MRRSVWANPPCPVRQSNASEQDVSIKGSKIPQRLSIMSNVKPSAKPVRLRLNMWHKEIWPNELYFMRKIGSPCLWVWFSVPPKSYIVFISAQPIHSWTVCMKHWRGIVRVFLCCENVTGSIVDWLFNNAAHNFHWSCFSLFVSSTIDVFLFIFRCDYHQSKLVRFE